MKAVLMAGGLGTRLRPVTYEIPKPLLSVKKRPIINYLIELFDKHGVTEVGILASEAHREDFQRWAKTWKDELPRKKVIIFFEPAPRGTFGGLRDLRKWLGNEPFFVSNADELKDFDLARLAEFHKQQGSVATLALVEVPNAQDYGVPILDNGLIKEFLEKPKEPPSSFINSGLYVFSPEVFSYADPDKDFLMNETDIFPALAAQGKLSGLRMEDARWYDCGTLERWEKAINEW